MRFRPSWSSSVATLLASLCFTQLSEALDDNIKSVPLRTHSLTQPYLDSDLQSRWFDWGGDTVIRSDQYIRLASDRQHQAGFLWSRLPLTATNWEIEWEFKIHGEGNLFGDGMALWITKQRALSGPVFGSVDKFEGLGVFFDTYKNSRHGAIFPYVSAMLGDGNTEYDNDHDNKGTEIEGAGCSARGIRNANIPTKAKLTYFQENYLQLDLQYKKEDQWVQCFNVPNITLPQVAYLGFSAHCGDLSDNHDVIKLQAKNLYSTNPTSPGPGKSSKPRKAYKPPQTKTGGWGWFFLKVIMFGLVCAAGYVGYTAYRTSKRHSSRF